ncbi:unnamed protein product [Candidula unifasciata]|uniref:Uncharacterized protein n=1 Tax=Candidula unifasciata TaxID=100452 RepID=A0A8S3ZJ96_9EUPU|nr:unnamed protein product [Candidula unifasciata]
MSVTAEKVCVFMLLILAVETQKFRHGLCQFEHTEDSKEDYATDLTILKALKANKKCNVDWSRTYYADDDGYIAVNCGRCSIYNLHVSAKRNTQHDPIVCSGLTPELFTSKLDCMWKKTCILRYSTATIVLSLPNQEPNVPNCVGEEPGTVDVGYSCLDSGFDVETVNTLVTFNQTVEHCKHAMKTPGIAFATFDVIKDRTTQGYKGFVKSHSKFPWNYPRDNADFQFINSWSSELHVLQAPNNLKHLRLQVAELKLAAGDRLQIINRHQKVSVLELLKTRRYDFQGQSVTFNFSVRHSSDQTDAGFLICYQWYTPKQDSLATATADLCSTFTYHVDPCGKRNKKLLKDKCGLWKKPKKNGNKQHKYRKQHRKSSK